MIDTDAPAFPDVAALVAALPEKYQPIFGHAELSMGSSRGCEDRLGLIRECVTALGAKLGRSLRVLDLGCAQGYFSLSLAADGHSVLGIDFLDRNVLVCQALAAEQGLANASFECAGVEDVIDRILPEQYDVVLGLSVFHHLVYAHGIAAVQDHLRRLASLVTLGIYEMALREEPLYWGPAQPGRPADLLEAYAFRRVLAFMPTHLSGIQRPLFVASGRYWYVAGELTAIRDWRVESHPIARGSHGGTRRYLFSDNCMLKQLVTDIDGLGAINLLEHEREVAFLSAVPDGFLAPRLLASGRDEQGAWLIRELIPGQLLSEAMTAHRPYAYETVLESLLDQLVALEDAGLYHNDVRCWNLLLTDEQTVRLIDYGAISGARVDCTWPHNLFLSLLITFREIVQGHVSAPIPQRRPLLDFGLLPAQYRNAFLQLFNLPSGEWSFRQLREFVARNGEREGLPPWAVLPAAFEQALLRYEATIESGNVAQANLERELQESLANAHRWFEAARHHENELAEVKQADEKAMEEMRRRHDEAVAALQEKNRAISEWTGQHESESARISEIRRRLELLHARHIDARHEIDRMKEALDASLSNAHHWYVRATSAEGQLATVVASRSWRLTRPLRFSARLFRTPAEASKRLATAVIRRVMRRPSLARWMNAVLKRVPTIHERLRSVAVEANIVDTVPVIAQVPVGQVGSFTNVAPELALSMLTERGRRWYEMLRTERKRTN